MIKIRKVAGLENNQRMEYADLKVGDAFTFGDHGDLRIKTAQGDLHFPTFQHEEKKVSNSYVTLVHAEINWCYKERK